MTTTTHQWSWRIPPNHELADADEGQPVQGEPAQEEPAQGEPVQVEPI